MGPSVPITCIKSHISDKTLLKACTTQHRTSTSFRLGWDNATWGHLHLSRGRFEAGLTFYNSTLRIARCTQLLSRPYWRKICWQLSLSKSAKQHAHIHKPFRLCSVLKLHASSHGAWRQFLLDQNKQGFCFSQVVGFHVRNLNMWISKSGPSSLKS